MNSIHTDPMPALAPVRDTMTAYTNDRAPQLAPFNFFRS